MPSPEARAAFAADAAASDCLSCGGHGLEPILDLGPMPLSNGFLEEADLARPEERFPLRLAFCPRCSLAQLLETPGARAIFGADYPYFSSFTDGLIAHARDNALALIASRALGPDSLVAEIASNDGYMLTAFSEAGIPVIGIDPAPGPAEVARKKGIETVVDFFGTRVAAELQARGLRADVLIANNVVPHVDDPNDLVAGMAALLAPDGVASVEFAYIGDLIERGEFDTIYHEHRCYFSLHAAKHLFERHGLTVNDVRRLPIHGGSLRLTLSRKPDRSEAVETLLEEERRAGIDSPRFYRSFGDRVRRFRTQALERIASLKADGRRLAAYGAAAKGTIMLNFLGLSGDTVEYAVDRNTYKQDKYIPGVRIPIRSPEVLCQDRPDYVLLLPWNIREEIVAQQRAYLAGGGRFILPRPGLEIIGDADA